MTPERWNQIKEIFHSTAEAELAQRAALLDEACGDDEGLRKEVETLVLSNEQKAGLLDKPVFLEAIGLLMDNPTMPLQQLGDKYNVVSLLGKGGMAEVYEAYDTKLDRKVAIKFPSSESVRDVQARKRLIREARAAAGLDHPNICKVIDAVEEDDHCYIVMEYVDGETLSSSRANNSFNKGPLDLTKWLLGVAIEVAGALEEAHSKGIIHRDIKPKNIMINSKGKVKVIDFGLAKAYEPSKAAGDERAPETRLTEENTVLGTLPYMSPEQIKRKKLDARSDIFSFGIVLYEMIGDRNPFEREEKKDTEAAILLVDPPPLPPSRDVPIELQSELERIVRKALCKDKELRYQSIGEVLSDLKKLRREFDAEVKVPPPDSDGGEPIVPIRSWTKYVKPVFATLLLFIIGLIVRPFVETPQNSPPVPEETNTNANANRGREPPSNAIAKPPKEGSRQGTSPVTDPANRNLALNANGLPNPPPPKGSPSWEEIQEFVQSKWDEIDFYVKKQYEPPVGQAVQVVKLRGPVCPELCELRLKVLFKQGSIPSSSTGTLTFKPGEGILGFKKD